MDLTVDGYVYEWQRRGGISRIFTEILPRICDLDKGLRVTLLTAQQLVQEVPKHLRIKHRVVPAAEKYLRPRRVWKGVTPKVQSWLRRRAIGSGEGAIWHSTYFTEPERWKGKRVVTVYDLTYEKFPDLFNTADDERLRKQMRQSVGAADRVIAISKASCADLEHYYGVAPEKIQVISPACSSTFFAPAQTIEEGTPFLLYVGDRNHYKNFNILLEGYGRWAKRGECDLFVVGGGEWSADERAALERLRITDAVRRLSGVDDDKLALLYNRALAFVYPSLYEGFGIPLLEAMACGCLVVASRIPSTVEVASDCPYYFEPSDVDGLTAALDLALGQADSALRRSKGLRRVTEYSWERAARETLALYQDLEASF